MPPKSPKNRASKQFRLRPDQLRWRCDPGVFEFNTTQELKQCPINIIGQPRALEALELGLSVPSEGYNIFVSGQVGSGRSTVVRRMLRTVERGEASPDDIIFVHNFHDPDQPHRISFPAGRGGGFREAIAELVEGLARDLRVLFESEPYSRRRASIRDEMATAQKDRLKDFENHVQSEGFAMLQVQVGPVVAPQLLPVVAGNPTELDKLEELVESGQFPSDELEKIKETAAALRNEMESLAKELRNIERELQRKLAAMDRHLAQPLVDDAIGDVRAAFDVEGVVDYLAELGIDVLDHLDEFREGDEPPSDAASHNVAWRGPNRYRVSLVVDNARTKGRPIIWETAPSYRNLFGTIETTRSGSGEWTTDHTRIRAGSLLRASGGILVIDAIDLLVEPGVWSALKRTLRNRKVEIQVFDPMHMLSGVSLKPDPVPIDVKVVMIGTSHIYRVLHAVDEDFKKVFKVKAEFAVHTPLNDDEIQNYACFVHKKVVDDDLLPFHRRAVAAIVEEGVRIAGHRGKLTTRFKEIADLIRESGYWAKKEKTKWVREVDVDKAVAKRAYRVNLIEEMFRERMAEGAVLIDLDGAKVGQVNGLAVYDLGDHVFAQPSRITATASMGRSGIIDIDREAELSGPTHTKGVFILTGFLRERFARDKPLTLTASLCFEQGYGPIDGDSASSTELYALLSVLSGVPIRQGIAVTGSVNQRGEIQPIGGANEKIEGYFELCRLAGLTGDQGVMIPSRNMDDLMLPKELIAEVRKGRFHIYAVSTIEEGLETLTGVPAGEPDAEGRYPSNTVFGKVDAELTRLAEEVIRFLPVSQG